jgi:hypothetical protein
VLVRDSPVLFLEMVPLSSHFLSLPGQLGHPPSSLPEHLQARSSHLSLLPFLSFTLRRAGQTLLHPCLSLPPALAASLLGACPGVRLWSRLALWPSGTCPNMSSPETEEAGGCFLLGVRRGLGGDRRPPESPKKPGLSVQFAGPLRQA